VGLWFGWGGCVGGGVGVGVGGGGGGGGGGGIVLYEGRRRLGCMDLRG